MTDGNGEADRLLITYLTLRKYIGALGISLPFILLFGGYLIFNLNIQSSISSYYHTGVGDIFVGVIFTIGIFLFSYKGYEKKDDIAGDIACVCAIGLALFPTSPDGNIDRVNEVIGYVHLGFASFFFLTLAYFSLCLFTKGHEGAEITPEKIIRNNFYRICGYLMLLALALILVFAFLPDAIKTSLEYLDPVFWLESIAIIAFGTSWLVKGKMLFKDST